MIHHADQIRRVLWLELAANLVVAAAKLSYGIMTGTLSMISDGAHSLTDMAGNGIGFISIHMANQPSDEDHHYGHQKYETLAALGIGALIGLTSWEIIKSAVHRLEDPPEPSFHIAGIIIMVTTMAINAGVSFWERKKGEELDSALLKADAYHTGSDVWVSLTVLLSITAIHFNILWVDSVVSFGIALYLSYIAFKLVKENIAVLTDAAYIRPEAVAEIAKAVPGVLGCHHVRTRGKMGYAFVDLHVQVDPKTDTVASHKIIHTIESRIKAGIDGVQDVMIHTEPWPDYD